MIGYRIQRTDLVFGCETKRLDGDGYYYIAWNGPAGHSSTQGPAWRHDSDCLPQGCAGSGDCAFRPTGDSGACAQGRGGTAMTVQFRGKSSPQMGVMLLIVAAGYAMRRFHWIDKSADGAFSQIIVRMTAPALVFYGVVANREQLLSGSFAAGGVGGWCHCVDCRLARGVGVSREKNFTRSTAPCCASPPCSGMSLFWAFPFVMDCLVRKA